ncbi:uncharacterized protein LOC112058104 [Bicyclus anynana]|uniref:Uncharacterized protein LOC112058104 n=1 Tax=Bicyclus anynana TaxID=110368 RepID=A0ABM3LUH1_BICAN|nr:uncharacterized protein LOC112058104 [Bicyclus anynana]XP_052742716.1 uncharacterized protein LOC112058104 [Bicyclus anynana]
MAQFPLNELKRRLRDDAIPLPKRLRLAKNVVQSQHFPTVPKERVVADWVNKLIQDDKINSRELRDILSWLNGDIDFTNELKYKIIKVVSQYLHGSTLHEEDISNIISFLTNKKITPQLNYLPENFLFITKTLLQTLHSIRSENLDKIHILLNNISVYYKDSKKKMEFISKIIFGECLEHVFSYLDTECHDAVMSLCQNIFFPLSRKQAFLQFFNHMIRTDNVDEIACDKSENMQAVVKVMRGFFTFPNGRVEGEPAFLNDFITTFVSCLRSESHVVFGFYIMATSALNMPQNYLIPAMKMPPIMFEENNDKIKRNIFLKMLEALLKNDVDITATLTDTSGAKVSKVEVKKTFMSFLQSVMLGQLKLEGKLDKTTLRIIKTALKLDPSLVEQKMDQILPHIMTAKKNNPDFLACYTDMMNCLLETLFKLSRGTEFLHQMIPHIKVSLEASNIEQFELKQKLNDASNTNPDRIIAKIITGKDILPLECIMVYGKLSAELLFRQNRELLLSLQKDFEENCLMMLEEGFVSPSIITLSETIISVLASFLHHCKMSDHTVPQNLAEEFWTSFQEFEDNCLNKFGKCILKLNYNPVLVLAFLKICLSFCQLKLLNIKYSNIKVQVIDNELIPFLGKEKWLTFTSKFDDPEANVIWIQILLIKTMAMEVLADGTADERSLEIISESKTIIIKRIFDCPQYLLYDKYITTNLFRNLNNNQLKMVSKSFLKSYTNYSDLRIFKTEAVVNNEELLQALLYKVIRNICDCIENANVISKALNKYGFDIISFRKHVDVKECLNCTNMKNQVEIKLGEMIDVFKQLQIHCLGESYQLVAIYVLLIIKKCCQSKKIKKSIDYILQSIFELSAKYPDLYKLFPIDYIFDFEDTTLMDLLILTIRTPNSALLIKIVLETAVKKVKTDSEVVKNVVEILLTNHKSKGTIISIDYFKDPVFQITCVLLPLIAKEKKAITTSAYRSILAHLQDKLNKAMLHSFKDIDFSSIVYEDAGNTVFPPSICVPIIKKKPKDAAPALNAMGAYSLSLLMYCESNDPKEIEKMDCLLSGLDFFIQNAIQAIQRPSSKNLHVDQSLHLLNVALRYIKKLETHEIFQNKDKLFQKIWQCVGNRLILIYLTEKIANNCMDEIAITLKFLSELSTVECFNTHFVGQLSSLALLKKPSLILKNPDITNTQLTLRKVSKYLWQSCLKANIIEPKCVSLTKLIMRTTKNVRFWIQQHYGCVQNGGNDVTQDDDDEMQIVNTRVKDEEPIKIFKVDDSICELLRYELDILSEVILAAKKMSLDYKFLDSVFEVNHLMHFILGREVMDTRCEIAWQGFVTIYYGCVAILNNLLLSREELLEDRWQCYMQCYKALVQCLCERSTSQSDMDQAAEYKLADMAHSIEKLTQSICKRKSHVSRIAAYAVADFCTWLENNPPPKIVRQHIENSISLLIQVSDSTYAMAFLKRNMAGLVGQTTMTNMYTMYKRYHKYVGNA